MTRFEGKARRRARVPTLFPPQQYPFPIPADKLAFYQYSGGMASDLMEYCAVDDFLVAPAAAILKRHALPYLFETQESAGVQLARFTRAVAGYNYHEAHALDVWMALHRVLGFVRVAADAEELASEWIEREVRDPANPLVDDLAEMRLEIA